MLQFTTMAGTGAALAALMNLDFQNLIRPQTPPTNPPNSLVTEAQNTTTEEETEDSKTDMDVESSVLDSE